ncbi:S-adenosyl-L-methionine-dependent methyltransferase [Wilcoxina mikolae CBS 423.85]|nr:S-adenosyl-L-methionine-dependent methyltransferase [Wilcoxina mikolae CBS 423.85]
MTDLELRKNDSDIEVDPAVVSNEDDDAYDSAGYDTSSASLTSSINEYIFENANTSNLVKIHTSCTLLMSQQKEQDRLDLHHEIMLSLLGGKLHLAPIKDPQRILDIGTGTGRYPSAEVLGTDLSPIQPGWVPPNCRFQADDAELDWTFEESSYDFIHSRNLAQAISDWPKLMSQMYRTTKPGGYVELAELGGELFSDDNTMTADNGFKVVCELFVEALAKIARSSATPERLRSLLENAGFVDVEVVNVKQPFGPWPKDPNLKRIGTMVLLNSEAGLEAYCLALFTRVLGMEIEEVEKLCRTAFAAVKNKNNHTYSYL